MFQALTEDMDHHHLVIHTLQVHHEREAQIIRPQTTQKLLVRTLMHNILHVHLAG